MFDKLFGGDPQSQGSLAAIAQILQASGPSRTPRGLYQILGSGMAAGQEATQQAQQLSQQSQLRDLQIKEAQGEMQAREAQRKRAQDLIALNNAFRTGQAPQTMPQPMQQGAPDRSGAAMLKGLLNGAAPSMAVPGQQPAMAAPMSQPGAASGNRNQVVQKRLEYAQFLRDNGYAPEAQAEEDAAIKLQPKVKGWEKVQQDGKVMFAPFFEDGTSGNPVPLEVAEKLDSVNRGGSTDMVNPFTGATVRSLGNSVSPDAALSAATQRRGQDITARGQNMNDARQREEFTLKRQVSKAPTEFQGKSAAFGLRATEADKILSSLEYSPAAINSKTSVASWPLVGGMLGAATNQFGLTENDQKAEQSQRDFINAVLRQESGAAIADSEFDNARKQYFPQPGDSAGVIAQKARARQLSIQGLQSNAGRAAMTAPPAPPAPGAPVQKKSAMKGQVMDGYRFKGGDPSDRNAWEKL